MKSKKLTALGLSACMAFSTLCVPVIEADAAEELESGELSSDALETAEDEEPGKLPMHLQRESMNPGTWETP